VKSAVETLNPTRVKLTVEVPFEELKPSLDAAYRKIAQQVTIPGFRKGRVPAPIIDQRVGRGVVVDEAVNAALPQWYVQALSENAITPLGQPDIDVQEYQDGGDFSFTAELDVKPQIELPPYEGLRATIDDVAVTDEEVEEELTGLRRRFGTLTPVDRPAADDDFVTINLSASKQGSPIDEAQATDLSYQVGRGTMLDGLDEALRGMSAGDSRTFESRLVGGELKGDEVEVEVTVTAVKEQELPDLDDSFAQQASEFDTLDELRADLRDRLGRMARLEQASKARDEILGVLVRSADIPLPEAAVAAEVETRRASLEEQVTSMGMSMDQYLEAQEQSPADFEAELDKNVRESMVAQFLLDDIADAQSMGVDQTELTQQMVRRAQQSGVDPKEYVKHAMEHGHISEIVGEVRRAKALAHVMESAAVTDSAGNPVELKSLQPDGTYASPDDPDSTDAPAGEPEPATGAADGGTVESRPAAAESIPTVGGYTTATEDAGTDDAGTEDAGAPGRDRD
jgi:trigger factor